MNGVQTRFKCKLDVKRCKRFVFPPSSLLPRSNALKTKAIRYFQTDRTLTRIVSPPLLGCNIDDDELLEAKAKVNCHDTVNMQYTSGTTGFPKGVMLTHYNISNNGFLTGEHMKFTSDDKLCVCVPLFHCFGVVLATMNCLTHGCTQVMVERFDPLLVLASVHKERCTALYGVPTMFIAELNHPMFDMFDMSSLRTGIMAGSLCPVELMKRVEEKMFMKVTSVYGLTEASPGMTASRIDDSFDVRCNTVGRDFEFTEVKVIDPETGEECPIGVQGEMCNKGYNTMKGYYKNPEATAEVIDRNGFLHSGDLGVKDEEGNYRITGRIKDMIIRGGENIYPREIEEFLYQMEGIKDVQVAGIPSKKYGEAVGAFIILHEGVEMNEFDIRDFCDGKIARYKIPKYIFFVDEVPHDGQRKDTEIQVKGCGIGVMPEARHRDYLIQPASCIKNAELSYTVTERNTLHGFFSVVLYRISEPDSRCTPPLLHKKRSNALLQPFVNLKSNTMKNTHANIHTFLLSANLRKR